MPSIKATYGCKLHKETDEITESFMDGLGFGPRKDPLDMVNVVIDLKTMPEEMFRMHDEAKLLDYYITRASSVGLMLYYAIIDATKTDKYSGDGRCFVPFTNILCIRLDRRV